MGMSLPAPVSVEFLVKKGHNSTNPSKNNNHLEWGE